MRLVAMGLSLGLLGLAPPCQESNPEFDSADGSGTGDTSATADTTASTSTSTNTTAGTSTTTTDATGTTTSTATSGTGSTGSPTSGSSTGGTDGCPPPQMMCSGQCVDTTMDHDNCGRCGNDCHPAQETCVDSMCVPK